MTAQSDRVGFKKSLKLLFTNKNFWLVNAYFFLVNTVFNIFSINIDIIVEKYDAFD